MVSIIIDDELMLRSFTIEDAGELFNVVNASRAHLRPWLSWVDMTTRPEHSFQFIQMTRQQQENQEAMSLAICYRGALVGCVGMHHWDREIKKAQLGYWIAQEHQGRGMLHRCLQRFIDFLFNKVGLNKLEIRFIVPNKRSATIATRSGFMVEGVIRQSYILNGAYYDIVITGLLKNEWPGLPENKGVAFRPV